MSMKVGSVYSSPALFKSSNNAAIGNYSNKDIQHTDSVQIKKDKSQISFGLKIGKNLFQDSKLLAIGYVGIIGSAALCTIAGLISLLKK